MRPAPLVAMNMSLLATACSKDTQLDSIARELEATVNRCVIDVRDKTSKYDTSPNCRALSEIAKRYIAAGGLKQSAPCVADRIAEGAHAKAWMALAISKNRRSESRDLVDEKAPAALEWKLGQVICWWYHVSG
jgi:hypothetical protein